MAELLDRLYAWFWRVPPCGPDGCYCRRTCHWLYRDDELPGMWSASDLSGGKADSEDEARNG